MKDSAWLEKYTILDKAREQLIKDLEIQPRFHPYMDAAKKRMQALVNKLGLEQDAGDRFLDFLEEEYEYVEVEDEW